MVAEHLGETAAYSCRLDDQDYLCVAFSPGARIGLRDARKITAACTTLIQGIPRPALVDFRGARSIDWAARRYFFHDPSHLATYRAVAILVRTQAGRMVGELFSHVLGPRKPARLFTCEQAARAWLSQAVRGAEPALGAIEPPDCRRK
jgi:hypothetical protein